MPWKIAFIKDSNTIDISFNLSDVCHCRENYCFSFKVTAYFLIHVFIFIIEFKMALAQSLLITEAEECRVVTMNMMRLITHLVPGAFVLLASSHLKL